MKKVLGALVVSAGLVAVAGAEVIVDVSDAVTAGSFKYQDTKITVKSAAANPRASLEYKFGESPFAVGAEYATSKNTFDATYENSDGTLDMKREEMEAYLRFGSKHAVNLKVGYRKCKYDITNGTVNQSSGEHDINGIATGDAATGADVELNLVCGNKVTFGLGIGGSYFTGAKYSWEYDKLAGSSAQHVIGSAKVDAYSARLRPEIAFEATENLWIYINYTLAATAWSGRPDGETQDYPGYDIYSAAAVGLSYSFGK